MDAIISGGLGLVLLCVCYFAIKCAVKNGIKEAYRDITGDKTKDDLEAER